MSNFRYNPLTGQFVPETITDEQHTIAFIPEINAYAIRLNNGVQLTNPRSVTIVEDGTGIPFTEQTARTAPAAGEFWVDYEATGFYGSGLIICNGADDGKVVNVSYRSLGRMVTEEQVSSLIDDEFAARLAAPIIFGSSVTAASFSGPLTGNVTGNLTGDVAGSLAIPASGTITHDGNAVVNASGDLVADLVQTIYTATNTENITTPPEKDDVVIVIFWVKDASSRTLSVHSDIVAPNNNGQAGTYSVLAIRSAGVWKLLNISVQI